MNIQIEQKKVYFILATRGSIGNIKSVSVYNKL